jgi:hypothetical protein
LYSVGPFVRDVLLLFLELALGPSDLVVVTQGEWIERRATSRRGALRAGEVPVVACRNATIASRTSSRPSFVTDTR